MVDRDSRFETACLSPKGSTLRTLCVCTHGDKSAQKRHNMCTAGYLATSMPYPCARSVASGLSLWSVGAWVWDATAQDFDRTWMCYKYDVNVTDKVCDSKQEKEWQGYSRATR